MRGRVTLSIGIGVLVGLTMAGCTSEAPSTAETEQIHGVVESVAQAFSLGDIPGYAAGFTDAGLLDDQELPRAEFLKMDPAEFGGLPVKITEWGETIVDGDKATAEVVMEIGDTWINGYTLHLLKQDELWRLDAGVESDTYSFPLPDGVTPVDVELIDFGFEFDDITEAPQAFDLRNNGEQEHEAVLFRLDEAHNAAALVDLVLSSEGPEGPEGVEFIAAASALPGEDARLLLKQPLLPGEYAFMCFIDDTTDPGHIHLEKGMVKTFTVEESAG